MDVNNMLLKSKWYMIAGAVYGYVTSPILASDAVRELAYNYLQSYMTFLLPILPITWVSFMPRWLATIASGFMGAIWGLLFYLLVNRLSERTRVG